MGWVAVTGEDRVRWLNGMVTNSIQAMGTGEGSYSFLLNAQGRIQGDLTAFAEAERLLLEIPTAELARVTRAAGALHHHGRCGAGAGGGV